MEGDSMNSQVKYGQELGPNLMKIAKKLVKNENLLMLLENTDLDPLNKEKHPEHLDGLKFLNNLIKVKPLLTAEEQTTKSKIVILFDSGDVSSSNSDNENINLIIAVYCPFEEWLITGETIRPFAIMSEIRQTIQDKRINGLGEITYQGFNMSTITEEMAAYTMRFRINAFS